jgi:hypothetical protein
METDGHRLDVEIFIDERRYLSPNPTTGTALYLLGNVPSGLELYREVSGDRTDPPVPNGPESIHLKQDEHFHSGPLQVTDVTIIVNGRKKVVASKELSFDAVVELAFDPVPTGPNIMFTITYRHGPRANPEGSLTEGTRVKIKDGMIFNVTPTDKS